MLRTLTGAVLGLNPNTGRRFVRERSPRASVGEHRNRIFGLVQTGRHHPLLLPEPAIAANLPMQRQFLAGPNLEDAVCFRQRDSGTVEDIVFDPSRAR